MIIYTASSVDIMSDILISNCKGSVAVSDMRQRIAEAMQLTLREGEDGTVAFDFPEPETQERIISDYIAAGAWQFVLCGSAEEASDFVGYVLQKLAPFLNPEQGCFETAKTTRYQTLLQPNLPTYTEAELVSQPSGPGVYIFSHTEPPQTLDLE